MQRRCLNCTTESAGSSQILFQRPARFMRSDSFSLDVRRFDQRGPFLDLALNKSLEIFGPPALGRNQNGAELFRRSPVARRRRPARLGQEYYTLSAGSERDLGTAFALCLSGKRACSSCRAMGSLLAPATK